MRSKAQRLQEEFRMVGVDPSGAKIHLPPMSLKPPSLDAPPSLTMVNQRLEQDPSPFVGLQVLFNQYRHHAITKKDMDIVCI